MKVCRCAVSGGRGPVGGSGRSQRVHTLCEGRQIGVSQAVQPLDCLLAATLAQLVEHRRADIGEPYQREASIARQLYTLHERQTHKTVDQQRRTGLAETQVCTEFADWQLRQMSEDQQGAQLGHGDVEARDASRGEQDAAHGRLITEDLVGESGASHGGYCSINSLVLSNYRHLSYLAVGRSASATGSVRSMMAASSCVTDMIVSSKRRHCVEQRLDADQLVAGSRFGGSPGTAAAALSKLRSDEASLDRRDCPNHTQPARNPHAFRMTAGVWLVTLALLGATVTQGGPGRFGGLLQHLRASAGLSQEELAVRAGLSQRGISDLERGKRRSPHPATVRGLSEALGLADSERHALLDAARATRAFDVWPYQPRSSLGAPPHNLPAQTTALIGRGPQLEAVRDRLNSGTRLVTLIGPGGCGKTRLGLQIAAELMEQFSDGVFFVPLAPIADPDLVAAAIAQALGLREFERGSIRQVVPQHLRDRQVLLFIDNFEHVLAAGSDIGELLAVCPQLKVLVTSRAPLRIYGEEEIAAPPLTMPEPRTQPQLKRRSCNCRPH